jgi:hypothetical protein
MFRLTNFRLLGFLSLSVLLLGVQAPAQFEVSPDHFDTPAAKQAAHRRAAAKTQPSTSVAGHTAKSAAKHKSTHKNKTVASASRPVNRETAAPKNR